MISSTEKPGISPIGASDEEEYQTGLGFERIVFFSDAVFAIAITLLVLEIRVPDLGISEEVTASERAAEAARLLPEAISHLASHFLAYVIGFLVLGVYWINHHRMFASIKRYDTGLIWLNLLFLMVVAFLPFPTSLLQEYGDTALAVVFYACSVIAAALMSWLMWLYATRKHRLVSPDLSASYIRQYSIRSAMTATVFLLSIPIAIFINPYLAELFWLTLALARPIGRLFIRSS